MELRIPKKRSYFPAFLEPRRMTEKARTAVIQEVETSKNRVFRSVRGGYWAVSDRPIEANGGAGKTASRAGLVAQIEGS
jgi:putative transposase